MIFLQNNTGQRKVDRGIHESRIANCLNWMTDGYI